MSFHNLSFHQNVIVYLFFPQFFLRTSNIRTICKILLQRFSKRMTVTSLAKLTLNQKDDILTLKYNKNYQERFMWKQS